MEIAMRRLPPDFSRYLDNIVIMVLDEPSPEQRRQGAIAEGDALFGLYEGVPLAERGSEYGMVLPDRVSLFRHTFERHCADEAETIEEIRRTIIHEVGHHVGFDEDALRDV
ncbi:MAG TPA: metallopeptidase family protein [Chloroflexota bacterium]|nr:metallopeptidase family protein [Chloroflexota bacterium]